MVAASQVIVVFTQQVIADSEQVSLVHETGPNQILSVVAFGSKLPVRVS
jgi:uncharacterized protein (DUF427 family)